MSGGSLLCQQRLWELQLVADLSTKTGQSIQLGTMQLAQGAMTSIRNPAAHEVLNLELAEALEMVAVFSLIARRVGGARKPRQSVRAPKGQPSSSAQA